MTWQEELEKNAREWLGTPYVPHARVKGAGVDCGGFLYDNYGPFFGPFAPYPTDYPVDWAAHSDDERYLDFIMPYVKQVPDARVGGFSVFKLGLAFGHAAIYISGDNYIHAWGRVGEGAVTITPARVMNYMARINGGVKHFYPKDAD
jgi:cell wall-associated NlpC family hydrolase